MPSKRHRRTPASVRVVLSFALCTVALPLSSPVAQTQGDEGTTSAESVRESMRSLLADIRKLLDASLTEQWFVTRGDDKTIEAAITNMGDQGAALTAHAPQMDTAFLATMLEKYAWWLKIAYRQGQHRAFDELLNETLDICIACHTRLPSDVDSPAAEAFVSSSAVRGLPVARQYPLLIATRRLDDAMSLLEAAFAKPFKTWPRASTALRTYVLAAVRVKQDYGRAVRTLETLAARADVPTDLRRQTQAWRARFSANRPQPPGARDRCKTSQRRANESCEPKRVPAPTPSSWSTTRWPRRFCIDTWAFPDSARRPSRRLPTCWGFATTA